MIVDCFMLRDELDLLEARLREYDEVVDYFVLVEATRQIGDAARKPLWFADHRSLFADWLDRIVHVVVDDLPLDGDAWDRERVQRDAISRGLSTLDLADDDMVLIGDVDEFPPAMELQGVEPRLWVMRHMAFAPNLERQPQFPGTVRLPFRLVGSPETIRRNRSAHPPRIAGHHFSWMPGHAGVQSKVTATAHVEFAHMDVTRARWLRRCPWDNAPLERVLVDDTWPLWFRDGSCPKWWWA